MLVCAHKKITGISEIFEMISSDFSVLFFFCKILRGRYSFSVFAELHGANIIFLIYEVRPPGGHSISLLLTENPCQLRYDLLDRPGAGVDEEVVIQQFFPALTRKGLIVICAVLIDAVNLPAKLIVGHILIGRCFLAAALHACAHICIDEDAERVHVTQNVICAASDDDSVRLLCKFTNDPAL